MTKLDYQIKIEDLLDEALNNLSSTDFEALKEKVKDIVDNYD